jgi:hypothetical protein
MLRDVTSNRMLSDAWIVNRAFVEKLGKAEVYVCLRGHGLGAGTNTTPGQIQHREHVMVRGPCWTQNGDTCTACVLYSESRTIIARGHWGALDRRAPPTLRHGTR